MAKEPKKKYMIAINDSPVSKLALEMGVRLAKLDRAKLYLVYVFEVPRALPLDAEIPEEIEKGDEILAEGMVMADETGVEAETNFVQARHAGAGLIDEARDLDIDMLIIGMSTRHRFGELFFGPTVTYILKEAHCQVLVIRDCKTCKPATVHSDTEI
ncbi:MAG: universal stress protein [Candidatus Eremiobacteraeota bacterium]|nr:universal stress protein [Candidatus Eremiobacteraeota bacterium]